MKKEAAKLLCAHLGYSEEMKKLRNTFKKLDKNGDGKLSREEMIQGFKEFEMENPEELTN